MAKKERVRGLLDVLDIPSLDIQSASDNTGVSKSDIGVDEIEQALLKRNLSAYMVEQLRLANLSNGERRKEKEMRSLAAKRHVKGHCTFKVTEVRETGATQFRGRSDSARTVIEFASVLTCLVCPKSVVKFWFDDAPFEKSWKMGTYHKREHAYVTDYLKWMIIGLLVAAVPFIIFLLPR